MTCILHCDRSTKQATLNILLAKPQDFQNQTEGEIMTVQSKPIPALYIVYILRSTTRHASLYIGSTPNPPRRLKQHNGESKGGATRTARKSLQPWEMVGVVSGFPSMVAALKFEYGHHLFSSSLRHSQCLICFISTQMGVDESASVIAHCA